VAALVHGNRGHTPKHTISNDVRDFVVSLATGIYKGASAKHMSELLLGNQGIKISSKSIVRILRKKGILDPLQTRHRRRRKSSNRDPKEGLLVQVYTSPNEWLEARGARLNLHGAIDDATGKVLGLSFRPQEDLKGYCEVMK